MAGGVAFVLHGYLRTTADLDLVVQLEAVNIRRALRALAALGYRPRAPVDAEQFANREIRERWIREKDLGVFSLWSEELPTLEVDLFVREPFDFDAAYASADEVMLTTTSTRVVPRGLLVEMKRKAGRPRDLEDTKALERLDPPADRYDPPMSEPQTLPRWTHDANRTEQLRRGLELTPAERLRWLETALEELRSILGRARSRGSGRRAPG